MAGIQLDRRRILAIAAVVIACVAFALLSEHIDIEAVHRRAEDLNGWLVFALITVLPLVGFPVTVTHAVAGMRFGMMLGFALVALSILLQLVVSWLLVKAAPGLFARRLDTLRRRLPAGAYVPVTVFTVLLPGVPYFAKNYVLALVGVPLRTLLLVAGPIHVVRSLVGLALGHLSDQLTPMKVAAFAAYYVVITVACAWAFRRVRAQVKDPRSAAGGPTSRG